MLSRDEDILKAAEDWRREGRGFELWIEDEGGGGAFYESFRLIKQEVRA